MYASNEDEDWIYLHKTPPINTVLQKTMDFVDYECLNSSESDPSISLSSILSNELESTETDDVSLSSINSSINPYDLEQISTPIAKGNSNDTPPAINENDVLNNGFELSETFSLKSDLRRRTRGNAREKDSYNSEVIQSTPKRFERYQNKNDTLVSCTCLIVLLTISFIFGQIVIQWDQPTLNKIAIELIKTNERLNKINDIPLENFQEKLTKQLEDKIQNIINQQLTWYEHEKSIFISQIRGLREVLHKTQQNLTSSIHQLTNENEQLHEQIKLLEHRLEVAEERYPKTNKTCLEGINCTKSSKLTLDKFVSNIFKQTVSMATDTSVNLSDLFEHLSASVSNIVDHHHEYFKASKQKLKNLTSSSTAEKVQISFRKGKSTYATWIKSRAQTRMNNNQKFQQQIRMKYPWQWPFQYNQMSTKEHVCYTKFYFPMNKICSMKNWMVKLFQP